MKRLPALFVLLLALLVGACQQDPGQPPLAGATMGGPFTLTSHDGRRVSEQDFAGSYRLVYFGYTFCPDVCPVDLQTISAGLRRFEQEDAARAARVQPIFITVDPARDTPEAMASYVAAFHPRLVGLTGSEVEIDRAAKAYNIFRGRVPGAAGGEYLMNHTQMAVLYGPQGEPLAIVPHDQGPEGVAAELGKWVR